jgi:ABC-type transporter lipoprotein component MlaA
MFAVNEGLDVIVKPVAQGYDAAAPLPVKVVIGNFFGNIWDAWTAVNNLLQGKGWAGSFRRRPGPDQPPPVSAALSTSLPKWA